VHETFAGVRGGARLTLWQARMSAYMTATLNRLAQVPVVSVAAVDGFAMGGGFELTTACDYRVAAHTAVLQSVHAKMGVTPGWGGCSRLVQLIGCVSLPRPPLNPMQSTPSLTP
jgi:enoyl-CoA hydratase/carnithine racemase